MAEIAFTSITFHGEGRVYLWEGLASGDTGQPLTVVSGQDQVTVKFEGTVGTSTARLRGNIGGGAVSAILDDAFGAAISTTAAFNANAFMKPVGPNVVSLWPEISGGAGADVDVYAFVATQVRP